MYTIASHTDVIHHFRRIFERWIEWDHPRSRTLIRERVRAEKRLCAVDDCAHTDVIHYFRCILHAESNETTPVFVRWLGSELEPKNHILRPIACCNSAAFAPRRLANELILSFALKNACDFFQNFKIKIATCRAFWYRYIYIYIDIYIETTKTFFCVFRI